MGSNPWIKILGGLNAVPFRALPNGARFAFAGSTAIHTKINDRGWYTGADGRKWRTGPGTSVVPVA